MYEVQFFAGEKWIDQEGNPRRVVENLDEGSDRSGRIEWPRGTSRLQDTIIAVKVSPAVAAFIAHPPVIHILIFPRHQSLDETVQGFDLDIASS